MTLFKSTRNGVKASESMRSELERIRSPKVGIIVLVDFRAAFLFDSFCAESLRLFDLVRSLEVATVFGEVSNSLYFGSVVEVIDICQD